MNISYDSRNERDLKQKEVKLSFIAQTVEMDFCQLVKQYDSSDDKSTSSDDYNQSDDENVFDDKIIQKNTRFSSDAVTCLRRLKIETNSCTRPTSKVLNIIFRYLMLEETNFYVVQSAKDYLDYFLFLHCNTERGPSWYKIILSALRNLKDEKLFKSFNISNTQELLLCVEFWKEVVEKVIENSQFTKQILNYNTVEDADSSETCGPYLLFQFIVKLLQKDFETWWKIQKLKKIKSDDCEKLPLIFYLFGGCLRDMLKIIKSTVLKLYKHFLKINHCLNDIRTLLATTASLISHLDYQDDFG